MAGMNQLQKNNASNTGSLLEKITFEIERPKVIKEIQVRENGVPERIKFLQIHEDKKPWDQKAFLDSVNRKAFWLKDTNEKGAYKKSQFYCIDCDTTETGLQAVEILERCRHNEEMISNRYFSDEEVIEEDEDGFYIEDEEDWEGFSIEGEEDSSEFDIEGEEDSDGFYSEGEEDSSEFDIEGEEDPDGFYSEDKEDPDVFLIEEDEPGDNDPDKISNALFDKLGVDHDADWFNENPFCIPIVFYSEVDRVLCDNAFSMPIGGLMMQGLGNQQSKNPYWLECNEESIIVVGEFQSFCNIPSPDSFVENMRIFQNNRRVYFLNICREQEAPSLHEMRNQPMFLPFGSSLNNDLPDSTRIRFVLDFQAKALDVCCHTTAQRKRMENACLDAYLKRYGIKLSRGIVKHDVYAALKAANPQYPLEICEKLMDYILMNSKDKVSRLTKEHLKMLGLIKADEEKKAETDEVVDLDQVVGLEQVKERAQNILRMAEYKKYCKDNNLPIPYFKYILAFLGAPGTLKSSMAKYIGNKMAKKHLLKGTKFISVSGAELKGAFVGQTAPKVHELFENNDIILIDEAYSLTASDMGYIDSYSQEALAQLMIELEAHGEDRLIIFAGYGGPDVKEKDNKMKLFLDANPGIQSRINGTLFFPSYDADMMLRIVEKMASRRGMRFEDQKEAGRKIRAYFAERQKSESFGNGREARSFVENCQFSIAARVMSLPEKQRTREIMNVVSQKDIDEVLGRLRESNAIQRGRDGKMGFVSAAVPKDRDL